MFFPGEGFSFEGLCNALERISDFEKRANSRVIDSGVLKGLSIDDIKRAGERLVLQDGCVGFFQQLVKTKEELSMEIHVLSYCWCADLIRSALSPGDFVTLLCIFSLQYSPPQLCLLCGLILHH